MKSKKIIIAVIIIIVVGAGVWFALAQKKVPENTDANKVVNSQSSISLEEKNAIVAAILNQQKVLSSKDAKEIKAYFTKIAVTTEDKKELTKLTNQDYLKMASAVVAPKPVTAEDLTSKNAVWNVSSDIAIIRISQDGKMFNFIVQKVEGAWY